jgi:hypothetical protein
MARLSKAFCHSAAPCETIKGRGSGGAYNPGGFVAGGGFVLLRLRAHAQSNPLVVFLGQLILQRYEDSQKPRVFGPERRGFAIPGASRCCTTTLAPESRASAGAGFETLFFGVRAQVSLVSIGPLFWLRSHACLVSIAPRTSRLRTENAAHRDGIAVTVCGPSVLRDQAFDISCLAGRGSTAFHPHRQVATLSRARVKRQWSAVRPLDTFPRTASRTTAMRRDRERNPALSFEKARRCPQTVFEPRHNAASSASRGAPFFLKKRVGKGTNRASVGQ